MDRVPIWVMGAGIILGSIISSAATFGTYGYFRETKKMKPWKAGAATGAVSGIVAVGLTLLFGELQDRYAGLGFVGQLPTPNVRLRKRFPSAYKTIGQLPAPNVNLRRRYPSAYKQMGMLVAERLGCSACG